ncbi:uncharacterized protein TM_1410-like [Paramacrobiotus metropolitanus]|uniref:uncharacterized protein TM_1410-like n=1 Tax=Paramacrobiotus metropolitanus TaxID=2943436 RepID=UPI0024463A61|nr:uncharacterized protein TM_1410-like [Paramacrobiotus metropolitanus]
MNLAIIFLCGFALLLRCGLGRAAGQAKATTGAVVVSTSAKSVISVKMVQPNIYSEPLVYAKLNAAYDQLDMIKNSNYSVIILDPQESGLNHDQIMELRHGTNRTILAYVSIGIADTSKPYWRPQWTGGFFPDFVVQPQYTELTPGHYWVQFWKAYWQRMLLRYIQEQVLSLGYSGLLLDNLDVYLRDTNPDIDEREEMITFVQVIKEQAQQFYKDTKIFVSNISELYSVDRFRKTVDGFLVENLWFEKDKNLLKENKTKVDQKLSILQQAQRDGKVIISLDYSTNDSDVCTFYEHCSLQKFFCAVTDQKWTSWPRICIPKTTTTVVQTLTTQKPSKGPYSNAGRRFFSLLNLTLGIVAVMCMLQWL